MNLATRQRWFSNLQPASRSDANQRLGAVYIAICLTVLFGCSERAVNSPQASGHEVVNSVGIKLVEIPPGEFWMGSDDQKSVAKGEGPRHQVRITKGFWIGKFEVTQAEYEKLTGVNPSQFYATGDAASAVGDADTSRYPVDRVTWEEAVEFCRRLSALPEEKAAHRTYRLPTEAEWEYACRAGEAMTEGDVENPSTATANISAPAALDAPKLGRTGQVGSFPANRWGLHDMQGNVWEWCADGRRQYESTSETDPRGPEMLVAVLRGGAWDFPAEYASATHRQTALKGYVYFGIRVVCEIKPQPE